nr:CYP3 [Erythropodium caribaeorum]
MFLEVCLSLTVVWFLWYMMTTYHSRRLTPPGPFPLPLIGNTHLIGSNPPFTMDKLWETYGDVYQVKFPVGTFVIVNSFEAAREALITRKDDFAGRPIDLMYPVDIITEGKSVASADFGLKLMFRKKITKSAIRVFGDNVHVVQGRMTNAVKELLSEIEALDENPFSVKSYISSAITTQLWEWISSRQYRHGNKTLRSLVEFQEKMIYLMRQGSYFQMLPFMKFLPTKFMRTLQEVLEMRETIFGAELEEHRRTYTTGVTRDIIDSMIASYEIEKAKTTDKDVGTVEDIKFLLLDAVVAGADTSITVVSWFILHMILDKDLQTRLQNELDDVVGRDRLPCWGDVKNLHYLQATVCEVMRHTGFLPWMPHRTIRDTSIKGYHVPKHTSVFINFYRVHRDPQEFCEPMLFDPGRFVNSDGTFKGWTAVSAFLPFGVGRRACLGQDLGKMQVLSVLSCLLYQFTFHEVESESRPSLEEGDTGSLYHPTDYKVIAKRRD